MSQHGTQNANELEVDIRDISPSEGERLAVQEYERLQLDDALILLSDHKPQNLHNTFEREFVGSFSWEILSTNDGEYRVRVSKRATTALPRVVADITKLTTNTVSGAKGSVWQLEPGARDLDSNIIVLPPHDEIGGHVGPDLDVLILVLHGSGELETELDTISLQSGSLLWLPRKAQRRFVAGSNGLQYFTVHQRKPTLSITPAPIEPVHP